MLLNSVCAVFIKCDPNNSLVGNFISLVIFLLLLLSETNHSNYSLYQMLEDVSPKAILKAKGTIPVQIIYVFFLKKMLQIMEIVL